MKKISILFIIVATTLLSSCGPSMNVTYDYDKSVDFTKFATFSIAEWNEDNSELVDDFTKVRLQDAMRKQMVLRGMKEVKENPDVVVDIFIVTNTEEYTTAYTTHMGAAGYGGWGGYGGWYRPGYGGYGGVSSTQYVEHEKLMGTIVIDVYDQRARKLAWQGVVKGELKQDSRPSESGINKMMDKIFYKYPIKKK